MVMVPRFPEAVTRMVPDGHDSDNSSCSMCCGRDEWAPSVPSDVWDWCSDDACQNVEDGEGDWPEFHSIGTQEFHSIGPQESEASEVQDHIPQEYWLQYVLERRLGTDLGLYLKPDPYTHEWIVHTIIANGLVYKRNARLSEVHDLQSFELKVWDVVHFVNGYTEKNAMRQVLHKDTTLKMGILRRLPPTF